MKLTTRAVNAFNAFTNQNTEKVRNSSRGSASDFLNFGNRSKPLYQDWSQVEMSDQDMYTGYSYAAIKKRANRASALGKKFLFTDASPALLAKAKETGNELEHPYLKLIRQSKEFSRRKFWHDISTYLDLEGVYYLMAVRAIKVNSKGETQVGAVQKFQMLNPYQVRRVTKQSDGTLGGYIESKDGLYREIPKEMIIEIRLLNPFNNDEAFSMTDAAKESQFTIKQAGDYTRHAIKGNINAPGAITTSVELDDDVFDNFVNRIENHTKGVPLYGNGAGAINWDSMQIDLDKAGLDKINEINRAVLFAVSGTSKTTLGIEESGTTRDTSETQKDNFTEDAVMPQVEDILDALNLDYRKWYPEWEKDEYEITLDNPLATNREAELKDIEIRQAELDLRDSLIEKGYEYEIAAKYAHGDITLEELGEPTLEPELSDEEADAIAAKQLGQEVPKRDDEPQEGDEVDEIDDEDRTAAQAENRYVAVNKMVDPKENLKKIKEAVKRRKQAPKDGTPESIAKAEDEKTEEHSEKIIEDEEKKKKAPKKKKTVVTVEMDNSLENKVVNQVSIRDNFPDLYENLIIDQRAVTDDTYRGCIMINTEKIPVTQFVKNADKDLFEQTKFDQGAVPAETVPHATLLYGLLNNGNIWKDKVDTVLEGLKIDTVTIDEVSFFDLGDSKAVIGLLEPTPELIEANQRLSLLPHLNTFSEYHPHITLAYINEDADVEKWVKALGKKYNGQKVATKGINYGDKPADDADDDTDAKNHVEDEHDMENLPKAKKIVKKKTENSSETSSEHAHEHFGHKHELVTNSTLIKAQNALEPEVKDKVLLQEANLESAVKGLEANIVKAVIQALREGDLAEAKDIISDAQEQSFIQELAVILAAYYLILFPIYAAQLMLARLNLFNQQGVFAMTDDVEEYISQSAQDAAESHVNTVLREIEDIYNQAVDKATLDELEDYVNKQVQARNPDYLKSLPDNPNPEDVKAAVQSGKFDSDPAYKLARDKVRKGEGLNDIVKSLQQAYTHISETRATTIAKNEANRVFNMSQYQADLQFLTEGGHMKNAYKRLRSRNASPCAVCSMLIAETRANPIPFTKNFADLGETLSATYKKPNGKLAVQKLPIHYEAIKAGNVHVNCNCEYELLIKNEDGTFRNSAEDTTKNEFNPLQKRDKDGKWTDGGVGLPKSKLKLSGKPSTKKVNDLAESLSGLSAKEMRNEAFENLGFNELPEVSTEPLKDYFTRYETGELAENHKLDLMYERDRYIPETQILGSGTYFSKKEDSAYAKEGAVQVKAELNHSSNVTDFKSLHDLRQDLLADPELSTQARKLVSDYGLLGALQGFDAIDNGDTIVVMNRSKLIIEDLQKD